MANMIREDEVQTVGELKKMLADISDDMPVSDCVGELLCIRVYEEEGAQFMEVA